MLTKKISMQEKYYTGRVSNAMYYFNLKIFARAPAAFVYAPIVV